MRLLYILFISMILISCKIDNPNQKAIDRLSKLYKESLSNINHPYHNSRKAKVLEQNLKGLPANIPIQARIDAAYEYLKAGKNEQVLNLVLPVIKGKTPTNQLRPYFRIAANAYLRKGEQENCFHKSGINACTIPFTEKTVHENQEGSRNAIALLLELLDSNPNDIESKWMLNIAARTIAEEDKLPLEYFIDLKSETESPQFTNVFTDVKMGHAGGSSLADFDNDGDLDIFVSSYHLDENVRLYLNENGKFKDHTKAANLEGITGGLNFIHGDVNNDKLQDILILRGAWLGKYGNFPPSLLINQGNGKFLDATEAWGLLNYTPTQTAIFEDLDNDGLQDLVIGAERFPLKIYKNSGHHFEDITLQSGVSCNAFVKGITAGDINNDGLNDIFISILGGDNQLYINKGDLTFADESEKYKVTKPWASFVTWFFDYDNDGWEDLYVGGYNIDNKTKMLSETALDFMGDTTNFSHPMLYKNIKGEYFQDVTSLAGLNKELYAMGGNYADVNNDGYLDIYLGTGEFNMWAVMPNRLFLNRQGTHFEDATFSSGLGMIQKGHGISFGDIDQDGDQDIFHTIGGAVEGDVFMNYLYRNDSPPSNWVTLKGLPSGVRATIYEENLAIHRTVGTGGSFGNNSLDLEVGLGDATIIDSLFLGQCKFYNLTIKRIYKINMDACEIN